MKKITSIKVYRSILILILSLLLGCGNSKEANLSWEKAKEINTKLAYLDFSKKYPEHPKAIEAMSLAQDFSLTLVDLVPASLDTKSLEGKTLTFIFVDVVAQWPNVKGDGKPKNICVTYKGNKKSNLIALIHWAEEDVEIELEGMIRRMNGGDFIHAEPLNDYPGFPTNFPSEEAWFIYTFKKGGKLRIGLFFEGKAEELESFQMFGQTVYTSKDNSFGPEEK